DELVKSKIVSYFQLNLYGLQHHLWLGRVRRSVTQLCLHVSLGIGQISFPCH
ncbi:hypothetical protein J6590_018043, partial [Homalodisca vitripennis]